MGKQPRPTGSLLQRIESLRLFLASEGLPNSEETAFRLASLRARLARRPPRSPRHWTPLHSDLLAVIREVFGENTQLICAFFAELPADYLLEKLRALPLQASLTAAESPVARAGKGCVERLLPTPLAEEEQEVSLRDLRDHSTATPVIGAGKPRRQIQWRSLRIEKPCAARPDFCALSITGASDCPPAEPQKAFWGERGALPRFSLGRGAPPLDAAPRCIIQRL